MLPSGPFIGEYVKPIGANDMLIAAHARSLGLTLVTNNTKEFEKIEGLTLENWVIDAE